MIDKLQLLFDRGQAIPTVWPKCLRANRITEIGLPKPLVYIGNTSAGLESRQLISRVPRGAYLDIEFRWVAEGDDHIEEFYDFWFDQAVGPWNVFTIDASNIPCMVPGWEHYKRRLPSQYWRIDAPEKESALKVTPSGCCAIDFNLKLLNITAMQLEWLGRAVAPPAYRDLFTAEQGQYQ